MDRRIFWCCLLFALISCAQSFAQEDRADLVQRLCHAPEITSGPEFDRMEAIHTRIQPVLANAPQNDIDVALVQSTEINAHTNFLGPRSSLLCIPVAIVRFMGDSEGEMAFVIAHELGHALDQACKTDNGRAQFSRPTLRGDLDRLLGGTGRDVLDERRTCESRADAIGFSIIRAAGYSPFDAAGAFGRMEMYLGDTSTGVLARFTAMSSTHPMTPDRIRNMRLLLLQQPQR